jgi:hypothetical protein
LYGGRDVIWDWFKLYVLNRKQRVQSKFLNIYNYYYNGVPHTSVLGPLLFNMYINDFPRTTNKLFQGMMLANDTSVLIATGTDGELNIMLANDTSVLIATGTDGELNIMWATDTSVLIATGTDGELNIMWANDTSVLIATGTDGELNIM